MAESKVEVCNQALIMLGADVISSLDESNKRATLCNTMYDPTRMAVLRYHNWGFARARRDLAMLSEAPPFGFAYYFQLPSDCLRIRGIYQINEMPYQERYAREGDRLAINISPCKIIYTKDETNPSRFDSLFVKAFAAWLAFELALPITGSNTKLEAMRNILQLNLDAAQGIDAVEDSVHQESTPGYVESR